MYQRPTDSQTKQALLLMQALGIAHLADKPFLRVSAGEQRVLLFARALIKNPQLLILDEPFHGMDSVNKKRCLKLIDEFAQQTNKSLIFVTHYRSEIPACVSHVYELSAPLALNQQA